MKRKSLQELEEMEASLGHLRNHHKAKQNGNSRFRAVTFITCIGPDALEVHSGLPFRSDEEKQDINVVLNLWKFHCIGHTNVIYEHYKFNNRKQEPHESIDVLESFACNESLQHPTC